MDYCRSRKYSPELIRAKIMGPNPLKLDEELLKDISLPPASTIMDLGCGQGITSVFLAKEYGFRVFATDLWSSPGENMRFFIKMGLNSRSIIPIHADATALPYAEEFFDAVVCTDAYNYFGRDPAYLCGHLLPLVKHGGLICIAVPGMKKDCHDRLPPELLVSWTPEQLDYIHDLPYWRNIIEASRQADSPGSIPAETQAPWSDSASAGPAPDFELLSITEMEGNEEVWHDWIECDNDYARGDRKAVEAGACRYLNFISIIIRRK